MKKLFRSILKEAKQSPWEMYHAIWAVLGLVSPYFVVIIASIHDYGVSEGLVMGFIFCAVGTVTFGILPITGLAVSSLIRYAPIVALPIYLCLLIGKMAGEINAIDEYGYSQLLYICIILSGFGYMNIKTAVKIAKENGGSDPLLFPF